MATTSRRFSLIILALLFCAAAFPQSAPTRIRLAVMDFSPPSAAAERGYDDSSRKFWGDPGRMMSELLTTHLVKSGRFDVVERARLYQLLNEQRIPTGLAILGDQAKRIGAELGVQAIIVGSYQPSAYGYEVSARVISVADGSALVAENALVPVDAAWMDQSLAILAGKLSAPWSKERGYVLDVFLEPDKLPLLMLDLGTAQGARVGRLVEISTAGDPIVHPVTKEILGTRDIPLATASVIKADKEISYARVVDRTGVVSTPVKMDGDGVDLGIERMQRVCLTDQQADFAADADMSILSVMKYVPIRSDIPDAKLRVDTKDVALSGGSASVRLAAGTHLVELQVGQSLLSREVTVTKSGVRPKEVAFRKADLASAVAIKPPDTAPPAQLQTVTVRTEPELAAGDEKTADQKLMALLPKPEEIDRQLREAKDQHVIDVFDVGLRALRLGYARGSRSYLSIAASRFGEVTRLAPELALGYFNLGLARFYLDQLDDAQAAFQQAVKLDAGLKEDVPLLWWERADRVPEQGRYEMPPTAGQTLDVARDGFLRYRSDPNNYNVMVLLHTPEQAWAVRDSVTTARFRFGGGAGCFRLMARRDRSNYDTHLVQASVTCVPPETQTWYWQGIKDGYKALGSRPVSGISAGWHILQMVVVGGQLTTYIDGNLMIESQVPDDAAGTGEYCFYGSGEVLLDWVLVTRY